MFSEDKWVPTDDTGITPDDSTEEAPQLTDTAPPSGEVVTDEDEELPEQVSPSTHLHQLLATPMSELAALPLEEVQAYEAELVATMHENGHSAKTFVETLEKFPPPLKKKLTRNGIQAGNVIDQIGILRQFCHEKFRQEQLAFEKAERERIAAEAAAANQKQLEKHLEALKLREEAERAEAQTLIQNAHEYGEQQFAAWDLLRQPLDQRGNPRELHPEDQALVDKIEAKQREKFAAGRTFSKTTARMEQSFAGWLMTYEIFGTGVVEEVGPVAKFDDVSHHIDVGVHHHIPGVERGLAIDFTINGNDVDLARKLNHGFDERVVRNKYATQKFAQGENFIPIVIALDDHRARRLMYQTNIAAVARPENPIHRQMVQGTNLEARMHHDQEILQYTVVEEALEQIRFQLSLMEQEGVNERFMSDHRTLVKYFEELLEKRKDLRDIATTEAEKPGVQRIYRVRDPAFIRSVAAAA